MYSSQLEPRHRFGASPSSRDSAPSRIASHLARAHQAKPPTGSRAQAGGRLSVAMVFFALSTWAAKRCQLQRLRSRPFSTRFG